MYSVGYTWSTVVKAAGTKVAYDHERNYWNDKVDIAGPTKEILKLMVTDRFIPLIMNTT